MNSNKEVESYKSRFSHDFEDYPNYLRSNLIDKVETINEAGIVDKLTVDLFQRLENYELIDKYYAYQLLSNSFLKILEDLEIIQSEGIESIIKVDPNEVEKTKKGKK